MSVCFLLESCLVVVVVVVVEKVVVVVLVMIYLYGVAKIGNGIDHQAEL